MYPLVQVITIICVGGALSRPIGVQYNYNGFTIYMFEYHLRSSLGDSEGSYILTPPTLLFS